MSGHRIARFYKEVSVGPTDGGFAVLLDGRPIKTPQGAAFVVPNAPLAEAIAKEWRAQTAKVDPAIMPLTRLANTAIDGVANTRDQVIEELVKYGKTDAICYRVGVPEDLAALQARTWDPLLEWAEQRFGARLACTRGLRFIGQSDEAVVALERAVAAHDAFGLAALSDAAAILHSLVIALAVAEGRLDADAAYDAAHAEAAYQAGRWGQDAEATARDAVRRHDLSAAAFVLESIRKSGGS